MQTSTKFFKQPSKNYRLSSSKVTCVVTIDNGRMRMKSTTTTAQDGMATRTDLMEVSGTATENPANYLLSWRPARNGTSQTCYRPVVPWGSLEDWELGNPPLVYEYNQMMMTWHQTLWKGVLYIEGSVRRDEVSWTPMIKNETFATFQFCILDNLD